MTRRNLRRGARGSPTTCSSVSGTCRPSTSRDPQRGSSCPCWGSRPWSSSERLSPSPSGEGGPQREATYREEAQPLVDAPAVVTGDQGGRQVGLRERRGGSHCRAVPAASRLWQGRHVLD